MKYLRLFEAFLNKVIYFAHPINSYKTELERACMNLIHGNFTNAKIINPGTDFYQEDFKEYRATNPDNYMVYFKNLLEECDCIIYLPFRDGKIGAGVWYEVHQLYEKFDEIYEIDINNMKINKVTIDYVDSKKLSVEETRARIKHEF